MVQWERCPHGLVHPNGEALSISGIYTGAGKKTSGPEPSKPEAEASSAANVNKSSVLQLFQRFDDTRAPKSGG